jgi:uncharacterized protein (TIGR02246 family)
MSVQKRTQAKIVAVLAALAAAVGCMYRSGAQEVQVAPPQAAPAQQAKIQPDSPEVAAVRKSAELFTKAFNDGDAKAVAAFWTPEGQYIESSGMKLEGRAAIEKAYAEFFKKMPKARVEVHIETIRLLGKNTALEDGTLKLYLPGEPEPGISRYSVLHIREDNNWLMATVHEWMVDPTELITLKNVEWLIGQWTAKTKGGELSLKFEWDEDKAYLRGRYVLKLQDKVAASGTQIVGKNPDGGLRSWAFDASGSYGESVWHLDEGKWISEAIGTQSDGTDTGAVNVLIQLGPDAFSYQTIEQSTGGTQLPAGPPIQFARVKSGK